MAASSTPGELARNSRWRFPAARFASGAATWAGYHRHEVYAASTAARCRVAGMEPIASQRW